MYSYLYIIKYFNICTYYYHYHYYYYYFWNSREITRHDHSYREMFIKNIIIIIITIIIIIIIIIITKAS